MNNYGILNFNSIINEVKLEYISITPIHVFFGEEEDFDSNNEELFRKTDELGITPSTSQPKTSQLIEQFTIMLEKYDYVFVICPSSSISGTYSNTVLASKEVDETKITVIESNSVGFSEHYLTNIIVNAIVNGDDYNQINQKINDARNKIETFVIPGSLKYLQKSGRVNLAQLIIGNMFKLKLLLRSVQPNNVVYKKSRGLNSLLNDVKKEIQAEGVTRVYYATISCTTNYEDILKGYAAEKDIEFINLGHASKVIAAHFGPETMAFSVVKDHDVE